MSAVVIRERLIGTAQWYELVTTPRREQDPARPDPVPDRLCAALTAAHARLRAEGSDQQPALTVGWVRPPRQRSIRFLLGGSPSLPPALGESDPVDHLTPILYPPGTRARALGTGEVAGLLEEFPCWLPCYGRFDVLYAAEQVPREPAQQRGAFDEYAANLQQPFAWLVRAEPVPTEAVAAEQATLAMRIPGLRQRENSETDRLELERARARYRELARGSAGGMWNVGVLVGAATAADAQVAASLLSSASALHDLPYLLTPGQTPASLDQVCDESEAQGGRGQFPFLASSELVASIARPPARELPGIRLVAPSTFDVTPEADGGVELGRVLDESLMDAGPFRVRPATLNRHMFVCGATGAGKSQTVRAVLERLSEAGVGWLVIEPAKAEYARMAGRLAGQAEVLVIRPGDQDVPPASLNPLEPEPGFSLQTHIDLVRALFLAAFEAHEPFPQVLSHALVRCYQELGWELALGAPRRPGITPRYPGLVDLQRVAQQVVADIGYGREVTSDVRGFIDVRLGSLRLGTPGRFFEGGHPVDVAELFRRNVVLELEDVGSDQDKAFCIGAVLIRLVEHLRMRHQHDERPPQLQHVTVVEEAHRLLRKAEPGSPAAHAVELFASLLAEVRAYGEGIVVAEQIPSKLAPDVIKNTALKVVHRLPAHDDRYTVGETMNLDEGQSEYVVTLQPGTAAAFADGMDRPLLVQVPLGEDRETARGATSVVPLKRVRGGACGHSCRELRPCTLRELTEAGVLADDSRLVLWIELLTVAHLVGEAEPEPDRAWLEGLRERADLRRLECAVGQLAQAGIDARYAGLAEHYQPEALAAHAAARATAWLAGDGPRCDGSEAEWQAGRLRWVDVARALRDPAIPQDAPHPWTEAWRERGLELWGSTIAEQRSELERHPSTWQPSPAVVCGGDPPLVEAAAARLSNLPEAIDRLSDAIRFLNTTSDWPELRLYRAERMRRKPASEATSNRNEPRHGER